VKISHPLWTSLINLSNRHACACTGCHMATAAMASDAKKHALAVVSMDTTRSSVKL
jgi:hypothetical protein